MTDLPERWKWQTVSMSAEKATPPWITARVEATLSLYYRPDISEEADLLSAATWIDVLRDIPKDAVDQAFCEWVRNEEKRPTPAGIRKRALARVVGPVPVPADNATFSPVVIDAGELARRREMATKLRREFPMLNRITVMEGD